VYIYIYIYNSLFLDFFWTYQAKIHWDSIAQSQYIDTRRVGAHVEVYICCNCLIFLLLKLLYICLKTYMIDLLITQNDCKNPAYIVIVVCNCNALDRWSHSHTRCCSEWLTSYNFYPCSNSLLFFSFFFFKNRGRVSKGLLY